MPRLRPADQFDPNGTPGDGSTTQDDDDTLTPTVVEVADLSLSKAVTIIGDTAPLGSFNAGDTVRFTLTLANAGPNNATGVAVRDALPTGYTGATNISHGGSYIAPNVDWSGLAVSVGGSLQLTFDATVLANGSYTNYAQITAGDQLDIDSTPGDDSLTQDDNDAIDPTVLGSISGVAYNDLDRDGIRDPGEPALPGWTIFLDADDDGVFDAGETVASTSADGFYEFTGLAAGQYTVREVLPPGWELSFPANTGSHAVLLVNGAHDADNDFGNFRRQVIVLAQDKTPKAPAYVQVIDKDSGLELAKFVPYPESSKFVGGVRIATGDLTGDGIDEIVTAPGRGLAAEIRVFTQAGTELVEFRTLAYPTKNQGGAQVAVGDVNGDGKNDLVTVPTSGNAEVRVFLNQYPNADPLPNAPSKSFVAFSRVNGGGVVTVADMGRMEGSSFVNTLDGKAEVVVGSGPGVKAVVSVYTNVATTPVALRIPAVAPFSTAKQAYKNGVTLASAQITADGVPDLVIGSENSGNSQVEIWAWNGSRQLSKLTSFAAFGDTSSRGAPVRVTPLDPDSDGVADQLAAVQGPGGNAGQVRYFRMENQNGFTVVPLTPPLPSPGPWYIATIGQPAPASAFAAGQTRANGAAASGEGELVPPTSVPAGSARSAGESLASQAAAPTRISRGTRRACV